MTEITPETQALIDAALAKQREELGVTVTPIPAAATVQPEPTPIRLNAQAAAAVDRGDEFDAQMEALKRPTRVEFRGDVFDVAPADVWLVDFTDAMQGGNVKAALVMAIGDAAYARFRALDPAPGMIDHLALANRISKAASAGE